MHPTRDTPAVIDLNLVGGRVMPGVRLLVRIGITADGMRGRGGWRSLLPEASVAVMYGLTAAGPVAGGMARVECYLIGAGWREVG
jgi:hypothetical protein